MKSLYKKLTSFYQYSSYKGTKLSKNHSKGGRRNSLNKSYLKD